MTKEELELLAKRAEIDKQLDEMRKNRRADALAVVRMHVAEFGFTATECGVMRGATKADKYEPVKRAVANKYIGPNGETWTGRGYPPKWLATLEAAGRSRTEFLAA